MSNRHPLDEQADRNEEAPSAMAGSAAGRIQGAGAEKQAIRPATIKESLERERDDLLRRLTEVGQALEIVNKNPELERLHRLLRRSLY